ncbi:MAG: DegT/DnrJ/EryC1/StrS family aminotransferase, partial [Candidatus Omnitrophota bacterium]
INRKAFMRYRKRGSWYYEIEELGYKYNMDSIHAAIGLAQLKRLDEMNQRRRCIANIYRNNLDSRIQCMQTRKERYHVYHLFPIRIDSRIIKRDDFIQKLKMKNIETSVHFIPLHKHPYYRRIASERDFSVANRVYREVVSLPMWADMPKKDVWYVVENVNDIIRRRV